MPLDRIAARLRQRIPATSLAAFLSCFLSGYLIHLFAFTNLIPNSDGLSRVFDPQQMTGIRPVVPPLCLRPQRFYSDASPHRLSVHGVSLPGGGRRCSDPGAAQPHVVRPGRRTYGRLPLSGVHLPLYVHRLRILPGYPAGGTVRASGAEGRLAPEALRLSPSALSMGIYQAYAAVAISRPYWRCSGNVWTIGLTGRAPCILVFG